jgi:hypothetical protein
MLSSGGPDPQQRAKALEDLKQYGTEIVFEAVDVSVEGDVSRAEVPLK